MPAGQTLGVKRYYRYDSDSPTSYSLLLDQTLGQAAGLVENDTLSPPPRRFRPRGVYVEASVGGAPARKLITCNRNSDLYATDRSQTIVIDGIQFKSTGRRGERLSFGANPAAPLP